MIYETAENPTEKHSSGMAGYGTVIRSSHEEEESRMDFHSPTCCLSWHRSVSLDQSRGIQTTTFNFALIALFRFSVLSLMASVGAFRTVISVFLEGGTMVKSFRLEMDRRILAEDQLLWFRG